MYRLRSKFLRSLVMQKQLTISRSMVGEKPRAERANIAKWNEHVGALVENFPSCRRIFPTVTRQPLPNMKIEIAGNRCLGETKYEGNNVIKICVLSYFILKKIVIQRIDFKSRFHCIELISIPFDFIYTLVDRSSMSV